MDYLFGIITGCGIIFLFVIIYILSSIYINEKENNKNDKISGELIIVKSDYEEPYTFLKLYKPLKEVIGKKEISLKVINRKIDSHK